MEVGVLVDVERPLTGERVVGPDRVVDGAVALDLEAELVPVVDVEAVEVLVLQ